MMFLLPQPHRFLRGFFFTRCSRAAQQTNATLPWTLSCVTWLVGPCVASPFPSSRGNPHLDCKRLLQGRLQYPSRTGMVMPPTLLKHGHFQKSSTGPHKHHKTFRTQVQLIALPGHLSTGKENSFLCWVEANNGFHS